MILVLVLVILSPEYRGCLKYVSDVIVSIATSLVITASYK